MQVGCLGDIVFIVSDTVIETIDKATWSGSVTIQTHKRHLDNAVQEFVAIEPDSFSFTMQLATYLGVDPMGEIVKLWDYERSGAALPLTLGVKAYGKYRWLIKDHKIAMRRYDGVGNLTDAEVTVTLTEYLKE